jgi:hypothetical protein
LAALDPCSTSGLRLVPCRCAVGCDRPLVVSCHKPGARPLTPRLSILFDVEMQRSRNRLHPPHLPLARKVTDRVNRCDGSWHHPGRVRRTFSPHFGEEVGWCHHQTGVKKGRHECGFFNVAMQAPGDLT